MPGRRFVLTMAVTAVLVLVAAEGAARLLEPRMARPAEYHSQETAAKVAVLDEHGGDFDVVFTGTSQVLQGIDPMMVDAIRVGGTSYNVALSGAAPDVQRRWMLDEVIPRAEPETVVWGLSPIIDLWGPDESGPMASYDQARATRRGWIGGFDRYLSQRSALARIRSELRSPLAVIDAIGGRAPLTDPPVTNGPRGNRTEFVEGIRPEVGAALVDLLDDGPSPVMAAHLMDTVASLQSSGASVIAVEMPVAPRLLESIGVSRDEYSSLVAAMERDLAVQGVELLTPSERFRKNDAFLDYTHFSQDAAIDFSTWLGEELAERTS